MTRSIDCFLLLCFITSFLTPSCGYKILTFCPIPSKSHHNLCRGVVDALVENGHEVTLIAAYGSNNPKFRNFEVGNLESYIEKESKGSFVPTNQTISELLSAFSLLQEIMMKYIYDDKAISNFLADKNEKFDVVIFEYFFSEISIVFGEKYDCPVIALSAVSLMTWAATVTNNPLSPEIVPNIFSTFPSTMNLWQRVANVAMNTVQEIMGLLVFTPIQKSLYEKYYPEEFKKIPYDELTKRISLVLVNSHPSIGFARPLLPNTIEIGGFHIKDPEPLPNDLKVILDSAKDGVIYFSMGTYLKSSEISLEKKTTILKALGELKQTVLWKYETDLPDKPKNVIIRKWMPQTGILAHPNVKLFISHGGLLSCTEAIHFGVPLLTIPIFGDQNVNANAVERRGHGSILNFFNMTFESFKWTLNETLYNPKYAESAKQITKLYHDRPMRSRDLLVYYVEHVIRTKGAPHLSPPHLSRFSQLMLDVISIIFMLMITIGALVVYIFWRFCCCKKQSIQEKNMKADKKQKKT